MIKAAIIAALLQVGPCVNASPLSTGQPAPCAGILLNPEQAREALNCKRVEVPKLKAEAQYEETRREAVEHTYKTRIIYLEAALDDEQQRHPWWVTPLVGSAFLAIGYAVGSLAGGAR